MRNNSLEFETEQSARLSKKKTVAFTFIAVVLAYLVAEVILYITMGLINPNYSFHGLRGQCVQYDPVAGYKWSCPASRAVRIDKRRLEYDVTFHVNSQGYIAHENFVRKKKSSDVFRIVVLGDSFTSPVYLDRSWPEQMEKILQDKRGNVQWEVYNFGVLGGGLGNWHSQIMNQIGPEYDADMVIIASYVDDLWREFRILHAEDDHLLEYNGRRPRDRKDFEDNVYPLMRPVQWCRIVDDQDMDNAIEMLNRPLNWNPPKPGLKIPGMLTSLMSRALSHLQDPEKKSLTSQINDKYNRPYQVTWDSLSKKYGPQRMKQIDDIFFLLNLKGIPVVLSSVPSLHGLQKYPHELSPNEREIQLISNRYHVHFHNGYEGFRRIPYKELKGEYWFRYDLHWNQKASDFYAGDMASLVLEITSGGITK